MDKDRRCKQLQQWNIRRDVCWALLLKGSHGRDERVGVEAFDESVEFTYRLIKTMGRSDAP